MERRRSRQGLRENRYRSRNSNSSSSSSNNSNTNYNKNNYYKTNNNNNSSDSKEYSRSYYRNENSTTLNKTEGTNKKFENPKFFYKRVYGNYSKLYIPDKYEDSQHNKRNDSTKKSPKRLDNETSQANYKFLDVNENDENNFNGPNQFSNNSTLLKNNNTNTYNDSRENKKDKLKNIYSHIKKLEKELDKEISLEDLNEFVFNNLTSKHLKLITNYIELIQESYKIAIIKYEMDTKVWKLGIYKLFSLYRNYLIDLYQYHDKDTEYCESIKQKFAFFINESLKNLVHLALILKNNDTTNSDIPLHENVKFNRYQVAWHRCMFYINDLFRYQYIHELTSSERLLLIWKKAHYINKHVIYISPNNGLLYHQMTILELSKGNKLETLYYLLKSLSVKVPYVNARETHLSFFDSISKEFNEVCNEYSSVYNVETLSLQYAHLHGILYTKIGTENFDSILKRLMKGIKVQNEKISPLWIRATAICNIAMFHHYINVNNNNNNLLELPIRLLLEQLQTFIRIFLDDQNEKFLHYIEIVLYWFVISLNQKEDYIDLMKSKLKIIWPLLVKVSNAIEQNLLNQNINVNVINEDSPENEREEDVDDNTNNKEEYLEDLKSLKMLIIKNADNDDQEIKPFTFTKQYDLELRGFSPLHKLFEFIKYDDTISNYEQWYSEIIYTQNTHTINNYFDDSMDDSVQIERIIILMNIIKKFVKEIEFDEESYYWIYRHTPKMDFMKNNNEEVNYNEIDINDLNDSEISTSDQIDIFDSLDQDVYNNSEVDELRKKKLLLSEYITDPKEGEQNQETIINPQLTKIIFDTNCYIVSLKAIKNIFENTNLNIIIPLAVITELSGLQNCKKSAKDALDYLKYITGHSNHRALLKVVTTKGNIIHNIDNIYHETWDNIGKDFMNADDAILSCFTSNTSSSYYPNNNLKYTENILVSNDKNMRLKARVHKITAYNNNEFIRLLRRKNILS
ncbi:Est1 DNA/RNA binding domain-containing protein [Neocallimastix sp. 'constans']